MMYVIIIGGVLVLCWYLRKYEYRIPPILPVLWNWLNEKNYPYDREREQ